MNTKFYILILSSFLIVNLTLAQTTTSAKTKEHKSSILSSHKSIKQKTASIGSDTVSLKKKQQHSKQIGKDLNNAYTREDSLYNSMDASKKASLKTKHETIQGHHKKAIASHKNLDNELSKQQPDSTKVNQYNQELQQTIDRANQQYENERYPEVF